jgi:hypothetical protein
MRHAWLSLGVFAGWLSLAPSARAETVRLAIVAGNNQGSAAVTGLRYAESDAAKLANVLTELGGLQTSDLYLLQGRPASALDAAFDRIKERVAGVHQKAGARAMLIFYFSGHSDGEALELGGDRFAFSKLRHELAATGADVRIAIVDSCRSGALLAAKSGSLQAPFEIRLADDLPTQGTVLLTSSAATEDALESRELRGSYFTHNLVSGLRGAADASGDGHITLSEAYRYAYTRTVAATSQMVVGPQHPEYDMRLSGMGELVLTELTRPSALLELPAGFDRALVAEPFRDEILAEVARGGAGRLALPPGDYLLRVWRGNTLYTGRALVKLGSTRTIAWSELKAGAAAPAGTSKGDASTDIAAASLGEAIVAFEKLRDEDAADLLHAVLIRDPPSPIRAKAHLYLGLIALNAVRTDEAREQFKIALSANATIELPPYASPKAQLVFAEAETQRRRDLQRSLSAPLSGESPAVAVVAPVAAPAPAAVSRSHALSWVLVAVGAAALATGIYGAVDLASYKSMAASPGNNTQPQLASARSAALFWADAWIPFAAAGGLCGGGAVLAW